METCKEWERRRKSNRDQFETERKQALCLSHVYYYSMESLLSFSAHVSSATEEALMALGI